MNEYPKTLADALAMYHKKPTGNVDWDQAVLAHVETKKSHLQLGWSCMM